MAKYRVRFCFMNTDAETTDGEWHVDYLNNDGEGFTYEEAIETAREMSLREGVKWAQIREMDEPELVEPEEEYSDCEYQEAFELADDYHYTPSATHGDYSPSHPWDAPGMSVSDFI